MYTIRLQRYEGYNLKPNIIDLCMNSFHIQSLYFFAVHTSILIFMISVCRKEKGGGKEFNPPPNTYENKGLSLALSQHLFQKQSNLVCFSNNAHFNCLEMYDSSQNMIELLKLGCIKYLQYFVAFLNYTTQFNAFDFKHVSISF